MNTISGLSRLNFHFRAVTLKFLFSVVLAGMLSPSVLAQPFAVGSTEFTWPDPSRNNRQIAVKAYYPAVSSGTDTAPAEGTFPSIVFGHGFVMSYTAYENLWEYYVPKGYIFLMVDMENTFSPSHENFGRDILFTGKTFQQKSQSESTFPLYQKHSGKTGFAGHSMGGGASVLAASFEPSFPHLVVGMAPAETNPSAVAAAPAVNAPYLIFAGTSDAVTPPAEHQIPIYNALGSSCKFLVSMNGAAHCYYANANGPCDLGETVSGGNITLTREEQQAKVNAVLEPLFAVFLKGLSAQSDAFESSLLQSGIETTVGCGLSMDENAYAEILIFPNPAKESVYIATSGASEKQVMLTDISGKSWIISIVNNSVDLSGFASGMYFLKGESFQAKLIIEK